MAEYNKYAAQADTIKIEDITSDKRNQLILQRLKDNDPEFTILLYTNDINGHDDYENCYLPAVVRLYWSEYKVTRITIPPITNESFYTEMGSKMFSSL